MVERTVVRLTDLRPGERGRVVQVVGGCGMRERLAAMGIKEGVWLRVISRLWGPVVVECSNGPESSGVQIAVGRGMARRILVSVEGRQET